MVARQRLVVCQNCGRQFDANRGGYYNNQTRRYTCKKCGKQLAGDAREASTGMRQSTGAMIAKIAVGVMFLIVAVTSGELDGPSRGVGIVMGLGLIAWGLLPWWKAKKANEAAAARAQAEQAAAEYARANAPKKCPACGAMTKGDKCEYCGAALYENK